MFITILIAYCTIFTSATQYAIQTSFFGTNFLDQFDFWPSWDPTYGFVQYVDRATAEALAMVNTTGPLVRFGAESTEVLDPFSNLGRKSIRLTSKQTWTHGLFILDLAHMPSSTCGIWPAFWMLGNGPLLWPVYGELDIIEFTNDATSNLIALHTMPDCTIAGSGQTGTLLTNDCGKDQGYKGCNISPNQPNSAGTAFNSIGGGIYAVEWTSVAIRVWFFPRNSIPASVTAINPDTSSWLRIMKAVVTSTAISLMPLWCKKAVLRSPDTLLTFELLPFSFNIDFCGTWAGPTFNTNTGCPVLNATNQWSSCNAFVATNPQAFVDAYWEVNYLKVFQAIAGAPSSSSLSSVTPAESSTSVSASGAEGRSTTTTTTSTTSSTMPLAASTSSPLPDVSSTISDSVSSTSNVNVHSTLSSVFEPSETTSSAATLAPGVLVTTEVVLMTSVVTVTQSGGRDSVKMVVQTKYKVETIVNA
ncbi:hypothetical protein AC578_439 [Pseudocercospora eumusae]|uniref:GH16 domain-containing protein n=1 Tax=Pseudocercospora eumusae TaxID=321146 RepID=A0A139HY60_9PEZI|nr:hypothetical protein AC578_439 [Pseudocercospora eumusae]